MPFDLAKQPRELKARYHRARNIENAILSPTTRPISDVSTEDVLQC
jgi:hypothetical protein